MEKIQSVLERIQSFVGFVNFAALTVILTLQIVTRFVTQQPLLWSEEVARFLLFWLVMNGAALAVRRDRHFMLELFNLNDVRSRTLQLIFRLIPIFGVMAVGILMVVYGSIYARFGSYRVVPISQINMLFVYLAIPIFGGWIVVYCLGQAAALIQAFRDD